MESVEEVKRKSKGQESRFGKRYGFEIKLRWVKLRLEEGLPFALLSKEMGVSKGTLGRWVRDYQERGESGLRKQVGSSGGRRKLPVPVSEKMTMGRGIRRSSQRRISFFWSATASTIIWKEYSGTGDKTLHLTAISFMLPRVPSPFLRDRACVTMRNWRKKHRRVNLGALYGRRRSRKELCSRLNRKGCRNSWDILPKALGVWFVLRGEGGCRTGRVP